VEVLNEALLARYGPEGLARRLGAAMRSIVAASRADGPPAPGPSASGPAASGPAASGP